MRKRKADPKPIAYKDGSVELENLPLPVVHYPGFYGTFFCFDSKDEKEFKFCSCSEAGMTNYLYHREREGRSDNSDPRRMDLVDSYHFPLIAVDWANENGLTKATDCLKYFRFSDGLCHQCNERIPNLRWCHEMYGSPFKQNFGWYFNLRKFEVGYFDSYFEPALSIEEVITLVRIDPNSYGNKFQEMQSEHPEDAARFSKDFKRQENQVFRLIENQVRDRFGFKEMGFGSAGESLLFRMVKSLFPGKPVYRCSRPRFLKGLELDIFLPEESLAFEFQGEQHYQPVDHWGGKKALNELKKRDAQKRRLCESNNVRLIEIRFDDPLTEAFVRSKIKPE